MRRERKIKVGYDNENIKVGYCGRWNNLKRNDIFRKYFTGKGEHLRNIFGKKRRFVRYFSENIRVLVKGEFFRF